MYGPSRGPIKSFKRWSGSDRLRDITSAFSAYWILLVTLVIVLAQSFGHVVDSPKGSECVLSVHLQLGHPKMSRLKPPKSYEEGKVTSVQARVVQAEWYTSVIQTNVIAEHADAQIQCV